MYTITLGNQGLPVKTGWRLGKTYDTGDTGGRQEQSGRGLKGAAILLGSLREWKPN